MSEHRGRIHEKHDLSKTRRCELLDVPRSSAYYRRESVSEADLAVMRLIDEIHLQLPFYGSRRMRDELEERGHTVNRKRVQRLMRQMDLRALYPRRRTSQPGKGHKISGEGGRSRLPPPACSERQPRGICVSQSGSGSLRRSNTICLDGRSISMDRCRIPEPGGHLDRQRRFPGNLRRSH